MKTILHPWHVLLFAFAAALRDEQSKVIAYLRTENDVLRQQLRAREGRIITARETIRVWAIG